MACKKKYKNLKDFTIYITLNNYDDDKNNIDTLSI